MTNLFTLLAIGAYLLATLFAFRHLQQTAKASIIKFPTSAAWIAGLLMHSLALGTSLFTPDGLNLSFDVALSLVTWFIAILLFASAYRQPIESIAIIILPLIATGLLMGLAIPTLQTQIVGGSTGLKWHVLGSLLSFSLFTLAAAQALVLSWQNHQLRTHQLKGWIRMLPPLQHMEDFLFQLLTLGFMLLSAALISGWIFIEDIFAQHLVHKTVLSMIAWAVFALLLVGRQRFGWRGKTAINWTLWGFGLLLIAYFGSKLVLEIILKSA